MLATMVEEAVVRADEQLVQRLRGLEARRREVEAETAVVLAELDRRRAHRADGHATMSGLLRVVVG